MFRKLMGVCLIVAMCGCATSPKMTAVQAGDHELTKSQITAELAKLDKAAEEIDSKKGVTGTNVASALFFWPGLLYTYYDAGEANRLIEQRRSHLNDLYNKRVAEEKASLR